jgi:RNA polymerase primary sigma factor
MAHAVASALVAAPSPGDGSARARCASHTRRAGRAEGALDQYFGDISAYALLTRGQEADLARRIRACDPAALDTLVRANLRFVVSVAKKYQGHGVALEDLLNEGNLGLIRAAHRFDETKEIKFISYAVWWIRQAILQALAEQSRDVRVPLNQASAMYRIGRQTNTLRQVLEREPTPAEIAGGLDLSVAAVTRLVAASQPHLSMDAPLTPGAGNRLIDSLADDASPAPDEELIERALTEAINESLAGLKVREATILRLYFGFDSQEPLTLEQIGALLGVTRERVRQIKEKALSRLRHTTRAQALASFLT